MLENTRSRAGFASLLVLHAMLAAPLSFGWPQTANGLKARVQSLHTKGGRVTVTTSDQTVVRGEIVRVDMDAFTLREEKSNRETVIPLARVKDIRGESSRRKKAILIPALIMGGAVLLFCAAPYPLGFLCRKDPS